MKHTQFKKFKHSDFDAENQWHHYCSEHQIPFITVKCLKQQASVEFDYITYHPNCDQILIENEFKIRINAKDIFNRFKGDNGELIVNYWGVIRFNHFLIENAELAAEALYQLISRIVPEEYTTLDN